MDARSERMARLLEPAVTAAAVLVIPVLILQDPGRSATANAVGDVLDWISWLVFVGQAVVMLAIVPDRRAWIRAHPIELVVVVLTPPFVAAFQAVRLLRLLRLLWLFRLVPVAHRLFTTAGLRSAALLVVLTAVAGGSLFAELEPGQSTANGIYWAVTTMTTVGYGDPAPTTTVTKLLAVMVMVVGIGFVAVLTGAIARRFLEPDTGDDSDEFKRIERAEDTILVELRELRTRLDAIERR